VLPKVWKSIVDELTSNHLAIKAAGSLRMLHPNQLLAVIQKVQNT
jgi:hypothetical protein